MQKHSEKETTPGNGKSRPVAIIILNHNKKKDIIECLDSIFRMDYENFDVVVVDNASTDGSYQEIKSKYPDIHLLRNQKNLGVAGGRNSGIRYAYKNLDFDYILFLDDDIIADKYTLSEMAGAFSKDKNIGITTPKCIMLNFPGVIGYAGGMNVNLYTGRIKDIGGGEKDEGQFDKSDYIRSSAGLCLLSRELLNKIGTFDERFNPYGWEDVDFSLRARKSGFRIFYNHKAVVYHKGGKTGRGKAINEYEFSKSKNYFYLIKKHANMPQLLVFSIILPFKILLIIIKEILTGDFKVLFHQFRGFLTLFRNK